MCTLRQSTVTFSDIYKPNSTFNVCLSKSQDMGTTYSFLFSVHIPDDPQGRNGGPWDRKASESVWNDSQTKIASGVNDTMYTVRKQLTHNE